MNNPLNKATLYHDEAKLRLIVNCPHCNQFIIIEQLNCCIFRHGVFMNTGEQIPPHLERNKCDQLVNERLIYGCGCPFKIVNGLAEKCDYI
jgi:hypothetical protein